MSRTEDNKLSFVVLDQTSGSYKKVNTNTDDVVTLRISSGGMFTLPGGLKFFNLDGSTHPNKVFSTSNSLVTDIAIKPR